MSKLLLCLIRLSSGFEMILSIFVKQNEMIPSFLLLLFVTIFLSSGMGSNNEQRKIV